MRVMATMMAVAALGACAGESQTRRAVPATAVAPPLAVVVPPQQTVGAPVVLVQPRAQQQASDPFHGLSEAELAAERIRRIEERISRLPD